MSTLILQGPALGADEANALASDVTGRLEETAYGYKVRLARSPDAATLNTLRRQWNFDINLLPESFDPTAVRLLITDMDSTLITIECVDEIADFIQVKPQVSAITEAAMRGEIDFPTSLRQRVALLKGLDQTALEHVYTERLTLSPGAQTMLEGLRANGIRIALVSGGFSFFTDRLKKHLNLDYTLSNTLDIESGRLTGHIKGDIVGAEAKASFLKQLCTELGIATQQTIAVGDGANDLLMMKTAGLSVAFHAKPTVQQHAATTLNHCGLEGVLGLLDIGDE